MCFLTASNSGCASFDIARLLSSASRSGRMGVTVAAFWLIGLSSLRAGLTLPKHPDRPRVQGQCRKRRSSARQMCARITQSARRQGETVVAQLLFEEGDAGIGVAFP